ncbi:MAG: N-acetylmuramoyl-L-alanine amidase [Desulfuromonadales bacterium]|nr:N-acetylmuramoyl-L-alanine amidase [Desulfuromonadales bacterium]
MEVDPESLGRIALVRGNLAGEILYSAEIVEIWPRVAGDLILDLLEKGTRPLSDIQNYIEEIETQAPLTKKLCALVIGHKKSSPGAENTASGLTEFDFNEKLALLIEEKVEAVQVQRVYRRTWATLPGDINELNPHFIVSLHCNAFNGQASGTEVLYYHKSQTGRKIADILQKRLVECLGLPDRGIKPKTAEDRGGLLLRCTHAPCVIAEPFFLDNDVDLAKAQANLQEVAAAYAAAVDAVSREI